MPESPSDAAFRPPSPRRPRRDNLAWEAVIREELLKLRRRSTSEAPVAPEAARFRRVRSEASAPPPSA